MVNYLLFKIEKCRKEMILLTESKEFTSDEVIHVSQHLDKLLNQHSKYVLNDPKRQTKRIN